jgi:hypothetical protein
MDFCAYNGKGRSLCSGRYGAALRNAHLRKQEQEKRGKKSHIFIYEIMKSIFIQVSAQK